MANLKNLAAAVKVLDALPITTTSASVAGTTIDLQSQPSANDITFVVKATSLGSGTLTPKVQTSTDNSTWTDVSGAGGVALVAATPFAISVRTQILSRYVRIYVTAASATSATVTSDASLYEMKEQPVNGYVNGTNYIAV
jgi:hypothetical protein